MLKRLRFAKFVLSKTDRQLRERLSFSLDGIVLTVPPQHEVDRENYCRYGDTHMYRKKDEGCKPELAGDNPFAKQVPMNRAIPMWGGISAGGFRHVVYHADRKLNEDEWSELVEKGKLVEAVKGLNPVSARGPWWVIVDNESFLRTDLSKAAYRKQKIKLWSIPPKSPDLNPVEVLCVGQEATPCPRLCGPPCSPQGTRQDRLHTEGQEALAFSTLSTSGVERRPWFQARLQAGRQEQGCGLQSLRCTFFLPTLWSHGSLDAQSACVTSSG
jgi:hypothetical protein